MSEHLKVLQRMRDDVAGLIEDYNRPGFEQRDLVEERDALDAAISSLRKVPDGWVLVPREPTREMLKEIQLGLGFDLSALHSRYAAMLDAAPKSNPATPTSGDPLNALADDEAERLQYERDKHDPANCLTDATPAQAGSHPESGDREALNYLMQQFDAEFHSCERCGMEEPTKDCDSAIYLREYLAKHPAQGAELPELPELPEPAGVLVINGQALRGFTADQMRAYAELARRGGSDE